MAEVLEHLTAAPAWIRLLGGVLGVLRFVAYVFLAAPVGSDAQWQFSYVVLWIADIPISLIYFFVLPAPFGEAVVGPLWWAFLPYLCWMLAGRLRGTLPMRR